MHLAVMRNLTMMLPASVTARVPGPGTAVKTMSTCVLVGSLWGEGPGRHSRLSQVHAKPARGASGLEGQLSRAGLRTDGCSGSLG